MSEYMTESELGELIEKRVKKVLEAQKVKEPEIKDAAERFIRSCMARGRSLDESVDMWIQEKRMRETLVNGYTDLLNEPLTLIPINWSLIQKGGSSFSNQWIDQQLGILGWYSVTDGSPQLIGVIFRDQLGWTSARIDEWFREHPEYRRPQPSQVEPPPAITPPSTKELVELQPLTEAKKEEPPTYAVVQLGKEQLYMDEKRLKHIHKKRD